MVKDAESHAAEDKRRRDEVEAMNRADGLIYQVEKTLRDHAEKINEDDRKATGRALADLKAAVEKRNLDDIKAKTDILLNATYRLAEYMYRGAGAQGGPQDFGQTEFQPGTEPDEGVVDADYKEVD